MIEMQIMQRMAMSPVNLNYHSSRTDIITALLRVQCVQLSHLATRQDLATQSTYCWRCLSVSGLMLMPAVTQGWHECAW